MGRADIASFLSLLITAYTLVIFVRILFTWLPSVPSGIGFTVFTWTRRLTDPYLDVFRGIVPTMGGLDLSPLIAILVLQFGGRFLVGLIAG